MIAGMESNRRRLNFRKLCMHFSCAQCVLHVQSMSFFLVCLTYSICVCEKYSYGSPPHVIFSYCLILHLIVNKWQVKTEGMQSAKNEYCLSYNHIETYNLNVTVQQIIMNV
jgi:hypothetical protein